MTYRSKKKAKHVDNRIVHCDYCQKEMALYSGHWVINGAGQLLCYGSKESCFDKVFRNSNRERGAASHQEAH